MADLNGDGFDDETGQPVGGDQAMFSQEGLPGRQLAAETSAFIDRMRQTYRDFNFGTDEARRMAATQRGRSELQDQAAFDQRAAGQGVEVPGSTMLQVEQRPHDALMDIRPEIRTGPDGRRGVFGRVTFPPGQAGYEQYLRLRQAAGGSLATSEQFQRHLLSLQGQNTNAFQGGEALIDQSGLAGIDVRDTRPGSVDHLMASIQRMPETSGGGGLGGRRTDIEVSGTIGGGVPDWLREMQAGTVEKLQALRQEALAGRLDARRFGQEGAAGLAALREGQIEAMREFDADAASRMQGRLTQLDQAIDNVERGRVDPEAFFGEGAARRIGFGVSLALGALGNVLRNDTGPNRAAQILDQRIDRHIMAQRANLANTRAVASMRSGALAQMRQLLGAERAAEEAVRAAEYGAAIARLEARIQNAVDPVIQANGNALILAARAAQLQAMANVYSQSGMEYEVSQRVRTNQDPAQVVAGMRAGQMPQAPQQPRAQSTGRARRPRPQVAPHPPSSAIPLPGTGQGADVGTLEPSSARSASEIARRGTEPPGSNVPATLTTMDGTGAGLQAQWNFLSEAQRTEATGIATAAPRLINAYNTLLRYARRIGAGWSPGQAEQADMRLAARTVQNIYRDQANLGVLTGTEGAMAEAIQPVLSDVNPIQQMRDAGSEQAIQRVLAQFMSDMDSTLSPMRLRVNTTAARSRVQTEGR